MEGFRSKLDRVRPAAARENSNQRPLKCGPSPFCLPRPADRPCDPALWQMAGKMATGLDKMADTTAVRLPTYRQRQSGRRAFSPAGPAVLDP